MDTTFKEVLMKLCKNITEAKPETIQILRTQPLCNLKIVQRKSKNIKDPNPLSIMMSTISTKYPISVDKEKAKECGLPEEFIFKDDAHQHSRSLCKLEAVGWYLNRAPLPSENVTKAIDVLYRQKRTQVQFYYSHDWRKARIEYGETYIGRQLINTQETMVQIPNFKKTDYIMACLMPQYVLDYGQLNRKILDELMLIRDLNLVSKMTIQSQLRILINSLNSKPRFIPCLKGSPVEGNRVRHAFASTKYKIIVSSSAEFQRCNIKTLLGDIGKALYILISNGENAEKMVSAIKKSTYDGENLLDLIVRNHNVEGTYVNYLLVHLGYPILDTSTVRGFKFTPIRGKTQAVKTRSKEGVWYTTYDGMETVRFDGDNIKGIFVHDGPGIMGLNSTKSDARTFHEAVMAMAEYCRFGFHRLPGRTYRNLLRNARDNYEKFPWTIFGFGQYEWKRCLGNHNCPGVTFSDEIDQSHPSRVRGRIKDTIMELDNGSSVKIDPPANAPALPVEYFINNNEFCDFLHPREKLDRKLQYFGFYYVLLKTKIMDEDFTWKNESMQT